jgi:hypothetical protein
MFLRMSLLLSSRARSAAGGAVCPAGEAFIPRQRVGGSMRC